MITRAEYESILKYYPPYNPDTNTPPSVLDIASWACYCLTYEQRDLDDIEPSSSTFCQTTYDRICTVAELIYTAESEQLGSSLFLITGS